MKLKDYKESPETTEEGVFGSDESVETDEGVSTEGKVFSNEETNDLDENISEESTSEEDASSEDQTEAEDVVFGGEPDVSGSAYADVDTNIVSPLTNEHNKARKVKPEKKKKVKAQKAKPDGTKKKFKHKKKVIIAGALVGVLAVGGIAINATKDDTNYYSIWRSVVNNDLGGFRFVLDVRTSPKGEDEAKLSGSNNMTQKDVNEIESVEEGGTSDDKTVEDQSEIAEQTDTSQDGMTWDDLVGEKGEVSDSWSSSTGASLSTWNYPNYQVIVEGCTIKSDPLTSKFDISIATESFNDRLTTVTIVDDKVYIDLEQLKLWLESSKDSYFLNLAQELPDNSKNMVIPLEDLKIPSGYAESGEDAYESDVMNEYHKFASVFTNFLSLLENGLGDKGLSKQENTYSLDLSGKDANRLVSAISSIAGSRSSIYDSVIKSQKNKGYLDDAQYKQKLNEKDNFLAATDAFYRSVVTKDLSDLNLSVVGTARNYKGGTGVDNFEATFRSEFDLGDMSYTIGLSGSRVGSGQEIKAPAGSETEYSQEDLFEVYNDIMSYLNVTNIDLTKQLEITPDSISEDIIADFVELVNSTDSTSTTITEKTAYDFIDKYDDYEENKDTTPDDVVNAQLVKDFISSVESTIPQKDDSSEDNTDYQGDQFRVASATVGNLGVIAQYNEEESSSKMGVMDVTLTNNSDSELKVNLNDFSMQTLLSSKYPCNDYTTIHNFDNKFDKSLLKEEITIPAHGYAKEKLYVIFNNGIEHMELFYGEDKIGEIIVR